MLWRKRGQAANTVSATRGTAGDAAISGGICRGAASGDGAAGRRGVRDEDEGCRHVVVLTPEGGQLIGVRTYEDSEFTIVSQATAVGCGTDRATLQTPLMLKGPTGAPTCATEICTMVFPLEGSQGRKMEILAMVVETLEEYYGVPQNSMRKWQMQLDMEDDVILLWLKVTQPDNYRLGEMTLDRVTLNPGRVRQSTWKFLVCKGPQMTETVWLTAARAWSMPVTRIPRRLWPDWDSWRSRKNGVK
jgi:hypothetical protein